MSTNFHVLIASAIPPETRHHLDASGGADALRSAADAIRGPEVPDPLPKAAVLELLEAFAREMDRRAGPLSRTALEASVEAGTEGDR